MAPRQNLPESHSLWCAATPKRDSALPFPGCLLTLPRPVPSASLRLDGALFLGKGIALAVNQVYGTGLARSVSLRIYLHRAACSVSPSLQYLPYGFCLTHYRMAASKPTSQNTADRNIQSFRFGQEPLTRSGKNGRSYRRSANATMNNLR